MKLGMVLRDGNVILSEKGTTWGMKVILRVLEAVQGTGTLRCLKGLPDSGPALCLLVSSYYRLAWEGCQRPETPVLDGWGVGACLGHCSRKDVFSF